MKKSLLSGLVLATSLIGAAAQAHDFHTDILATAEVNKNSGSTPVSLDLSGYRNDEVLLLDYGCRVLGQNGAAKVWLEIKDSDDNILITYKGCSSFGTTNSETGGVRGTKYLPIPVDANTLYLFSDLTGITDASNQATLTATVLGEDFSTYPIAKKDRGWSVVEGSSGTFYPLNNDSDPDGDTLTLTRVWQLDTPNSVVINSDSSITFSGGPDYIGEDYFYYEISDGNGGVSTASIVITVTVP
ncbi:MAG: Ig-like domain-containing protein [Alphaproteobacteria bacterium]